MRTALAVLLGLAAVLTAAVAPAAAHTTTTTSFCGPYQEYRVTNFAAEPLIVRNDVFGADHECLTVYGHRFSKFTVTRSTASKRRGDAVAYPSIFYGCVWGTCSKGTVLPERAGRATRMRLTWLTRHVRPAGLWNTAYDIWFSKRRHVSGQAAGAELMIWLNAKFAPPWGRQTVRIAGARYWFAWHIACNDVRGHRHCWHYILFRRVHPVFGVTGLPLGPFLRYSERRHLLSSAWWLANVEAGFEVWRGATGVGTVRFNVSRPRT